MRKISRVSIAAATVAALSLAPMAAASDESSSLEGLSSDSTLSNLISGSSLGSLSSGSSAEGLPEIVEPEPDESDLLAAVQGALDAEGIGSRVTEEATKKAEEGTSGDALSADSLKFTVFEGELYEYEIDLVNLFDLGFINEALGVYSGYLAYDYDWDFLSGWASAEMYGLFREVEADELEQVIADYESGSLGGTLDGLSDVHKSEGIDWDIVSAEVTFDIDMADDFGVAVSESEDGESYYVAILFNENDR
ncbi:hypothetical protein [Corynebacterium alimapuense]|nr:hypothetical protein [Corynebacterium alimapuense]